MDVVQHRRETFFLKSSAANTFWSGCCGRAESLRYPSRFNSRPTVVYVHRDAELLEDPLPEILQPPANHARRQPESAPASTLRHSARRCCASSFGGWPGALRSIRPSGPSRALNRRTQSRTICSPTPPSLARPRCGSRRHRSTPAPATAGSGFRILRFLRQTAKHGRFIIMSERDRRSHGNASCRLPW